MTRPLPAPIRCPASSLDATFDALMRRVEHAASLPERQCAVDTLFDHRRSNTPPYLIALPNHTRRTMP